MVKNRNHKMKNMSSKKSDSPNSKRPLLHISLAMTVAAEKEKFKY